MTVALPTLDELLAVARSHYSHRREDEEEAHWGPEKRRRIAACQRAWEDRRTWQLLIQHLRERLPGCSFWDATVPLHGGAYELRVYPPQYSHDNLPEYQTAVGLVSFLAPVYLVYTSHQRSEAGGGERWLPSEIWYECRGEAAEQADVMVRAIEAVFGYPRLPLDMAFTPVPDVLVRNKDFGESQLIDCLFTDHRW